MKKYIKIEIALTKDELCALDWARSSMNLMDDEEDIDNYTDWQLECLDRNLAAGSVLNKICEVAKNQKRLQDIINKDKIRGRETEVVTIPARRRILSDKEKKDLRDEDVFMREYGLYTGFVADEYWRNIFKAIYGYSPSLL